MPRDLDSYGLPLPPDDARAPEGRQPAAGRYAQKPQQPIRRFQPPMPPRQAPRQYGVAPGGTRKTWTTNPREIMAMIADYARRNMVVIIRYTKATENDRLITRAVEPYSIRYRFTRTRGRTRYFYGYDVNGPTVGIHSFIINNIVSVQGTDRLYHPRWIVEF